MIDYIWFFMILTSFAFSLSSGNIERVSMSIFEGATNAVELTISLVGSMAFWMGMTRLAKCCGITKFLEKLFMPLIDLLFPAFKHNNHVKEKMALNFTANLIGLGNAATPLGLAALKEMEKNHRGEYPTKEMILFVVINTASLQILPTQIAAMRHAFGSGDAFMVLIPIWITSLCVTISVITLCKFMEKINHDKFS